MDIRRISFIFFLVSGICLGAVCAFAADDGFPVGKKIETQHFTVFLAPGVDEGALVASLDIGPQHKILAGQSLKGATFSSDDLGDLLEALFLWESSVLDMQLYTYKGNIKIAASEAQLGSVYRKVYGQEGRSEKGFYIYDLNTLYMSVPNFTQYVLGHEMAHAIISNFFVVQPPGKVAEVLAGYVEYQLRKIGARR